MNKPRLDSLEVILHRMVDRIRQSLELSVILSGATAEVRSFLGTDRVKIYQFAEDSSGEVVAESICKQNLPSLLGQHFPAEDIPNEVRQLYLQERQRSIVDVARGQIGISSPIPNSEHQYVKFRPVDPCHAEYLTAMGVQSSLVVPIVDRDRLWGLLVSHHSLPHIVTERELEIVQLVADQTSIAIAQATLLESTRAQAQQEISINRVGRFLHSMTEMKLQKALHQAVLALQGSGGRIYIAPQNSNLPQLFVSGEQPILITEEIDLEGKSIGYLEQHPSWQTWLIDNLQTSNVSQAWAIADLDRNSSPPDWHSFFEITKIKSILTIKLEYRKKNLGYLSIFRQGMDIETIWAKRPDFSDRHNRVFLPRLFRYPFPGEIYLDNLKFFGDILI